jgi:hypothetical protein
VSDGHRPVHLVFDTSAIVAFAAAGSIAVGELIAEIDHEHGAVGLPTLCLAEASRNTADNDRLTLLTNHHATVLLGVNAGDWRAIGAAVDVVGRLDAAEPRGDRVRRRAALRR